MAKKYMAQTEANVDKDMEQPGLLYIAWKSLWQFLMKLDITYSMTQPFHL